MKNEKFNRVRPYLATINANSDKTVSLMIHGKDSFKNEITIAEYRNFQSMRFAEEKAFEWMIPKSKIIYSASLN